MKSLSGNTRKHDLIFRASGLIDISAHAAKLLCLQKGDVIDIASEDGDLYLYVRYRKPVIGRHSGSVALSNKHGHHFRLWSKKLCRQILKECNASDKVKLFIGEPIRDFYAIDVVLPIITSKYKHDSRN